MALGPHPAPQRGCRVGDPASSANWRWRLASASLGLGSTWPQAPNLFTGAGALRHPNAAAALGTPPQSANRRWRLASASSCMLAGPHVLQGAGAPPPAHPAQGCRSLASRRSAPAAAVERQSARRRRSGVGPRPHWKEDALSSRGPHALGLGSTRPQALTPRRRLPQRSPWSNSNRRGSRTSPR